MLFFYFRLVDEILKRIYNIGVFQFEADFIKPDSIVFSFNKRLSEVNIGVLFSK